MTARGITLNVLRGRHDCTLNGISSRHDRVTVVGVLDDRQTPLLSLSAAARVEPLPSALQVAAATDDAPAVWLRLRRIGGLCLSLEPATRLGEDRPWFMFGGNHATTSDARWNEYMRDLTDGTDIPSIHVHDRNER